MIILKDSTYEWWNDLTNSTRGFLIESVEYMASSELVEKYKEFYDWYKTEVDNEWQDYLQKNRSTLTVTHHKENYLTYKKLKSL